MSGRGRLGELALKKGPTSVGRGLMTPGQFLKNAPGTQSNTRQLSTLGSSKIGSIKPDSTHSLTSGKAHKSTGSKQPLQVLSRTSIPPEDDTETSMLSSSPPSDLGQSRNVTASTQKSLTVAENKTGTESQEDIPASDDVLQNFLVSQVKGNYNNEQDLKPWSLSHDISFGNISDLNGMRQEDNELKQKQEARFKSDFSKVTNELYDMIRSDPSDNKSSETSSIEEKKSVAEDAEAEWQSFKLERQFNRILSNFGDDTPLTDIAKDFESTVNERSLSSYQPRYNELSVALNVLLTKVKNTKVGANEIAYIVKHLADTFPDDFDTHFQPLIEETKASLITVVASDTILSKDAQKFCRLLGKLYIHSYNEESRFHRAMCECISSLVESWTYPDGIDISLEGHQVNVTETHAGAVKILYEEIGSENELIGRSRKFAEELEGISLRIKESILNALLPRTVREIYLDAVFATSKRAVSSKAEGSEEAAKSKYQSNRLEYVDNFTQTKAESTGSDTTMTHERNVIAPNKSNEETTKQQNENTTGTSWDPYQNIKTMLKYLGFEEELSRFETNLIRDTALSGTVEDTKQLLREARFPAGLNFEIISYLNSFGPLNAQKRPQLKKEQHQNSGSGIVTENYQSVRNDALASSPELDIPCSEKEETRTKSSSIQDHTELDYEPDLVHEENSDTITTDTISDRNGSSHTKAVESSPTEEMGNIEEFLKGQTANLIIPKLGFGRGTRIKKEAYSPMSMTPPDSEGRASEPRGEDEQIYDSCEYDDDYEPDISAVRFSNPSRGYGGGYGLDIGDEQSPSNDEADFEEPQDEIKPAEHTHMRNTDSRYSDVGRDRTEGNWREHRDNRSPQLSRTTNKQNYLGIGRGFQSRNRGNQYSDNQYQKSQSGSRWDKQDNRKNYGKTNRNQRGRKMNLSEVANTRTPPSSFGSQKQPSCFKCGSKEHTTPECTSKAAFFF